MVFIFAFTIEKDMEEQKALYLSGRRTENIS